MEWNLDKLGIGVVAALSILACQCPATADNLAAARLQRIAAARATLAKNKELAWQGVITADRNELADLHKASIAAMRAENAQSVVTIQGFIAAVRRRLDDEKAGRPFPPGFHVPETYAGTDPVMARAEKRRDVLVTAAEAQLAKAEVAFRHAVLSADRHEIMEIKNRVQAAMKSLDANAVVMNMHRLKLARLQLQWDSSMGADGAPKGTGSAFMGLGGSGTRVAYIVDHSGMMLYNFESVAHDLRQSIMQLSPTQQFAVIVVSRRARILTGTSLLPATVAAKRRILAQFSSVQPGGSARGRLAVYAKAFRVAFRLRPQIVYFVSNGGFDSGLARAVKQMDAHGARVFACSFLNGSSRQYILQSKMYSGVLRDIATETGGQYRLIKMGRIHRR